MKNYQEIKKESFIDLLEDCGKTGEFHNIICHNKQVTHTIICKLKILECK